MNSETRRYWNKYSTITSKVSRNECCDHLHSFFSTPSGPSSVGIRNEVSALFFRCARGKLRVFFSSHAALDVRIVVCDDSCSLLPFHANTCFWRWACVPCDVTRRWLRLGHQAWCVLLLCCARNANANKQVCRSMKDLYQVSTRFLLLWNVDKQSIKRITTVSTAQLSFFVMNEKKICLYKEITQFNRVWITRTSNDDFWIDWFYFFPVKEVQEDAKIEPCNICQQIERNWQTSKLFARAQNIEKKIIK